MKHTRNKNETSSILRVKRLREKRKSMGLTTRGTVPKQRIGRFKKYVYKSIETVEASGKTCKYADCKLDINYCKHTYTVSESSSSSSSSQCCDKCKSVFSSDTALDIHLMFNKCDTNTEKIIITTTSSSR